MELNRFHDIFVATAIRLTGYYEEKFAALEHEINKLKMVVHNLEVKSHHDLEIDGGGYSGYDIRGDITSVITFGGDDVFDIDIDEWELCSECGLFYNNENEQHVCESSDSST